MAHISNQAEAAREGARHQDGKFGTQARNDNDDVDLLADDEYLDSEALYAKARELPGWRLELDFVDYDEELSGKELAAFLSRDSADLEDMESQLHEARYEIRYEGARALIDELGGDKDDQDSIDAIMELDTSDAVPSLLGHNGRELLRTPLATAGAGGYLTGHERDLVYLNGDAYEQEVEDRVDTLEGILAEHTPEVTPKQRYELRELVENGPGSWHEEVRLDVIWNADMGMFRDGKGTIPPAYNTFDLDFEKANLVLIDPWNGSGHEISIDAPISIKDAEFEADSETNGYGWDEVCGLVKSAYNADPAVRTGIRPDPDDASGPALTAAVNAAAPGQVVISRDGEYRSVDPIHMLDEDRAVAYITADGQSRWGVPEKTEN